MNRFELAEIISNKLIVELENLRHSYMSSGSIPHFLIDDLLPTDIVSDIYRSFPVSSSMTQRRSLREHKFIAAQMNSHNPILEEILYAFQQPAVVDAIADIVGKDDLFPDELLYAGGISLMGKGHFLNPHLDNSHNMDMTMWRAFNLLFYVSPDWSQENGGNLELWPQGIDGKQQTIVSKQNRLVVMATDSNSWHSVSPVKADYNRCCVSNYYFSPTPISDLDTQHVTVFRDRSANSISDLYLRFDSFVRNSMRKINSRGFFKTNHFYKK